MSDQEPNYNSIWDLNGNPINTAEPTKEPEICNFQKELEHLINKHSMENGSDTPDYILTMYLANCLAAFNLAVVSRDASKKIEVKSE